VNEREAADPVVQKVEQLADCLRYRPNAVIAAQMREAADWLQNLLGVAVAAKAAVRSAQDWGNQIAIDEKHVCALEQALEIAGMDMTLTELETRWRAEN
jgi:DNA-binding LacI/PurR family transcriptional regulator